MMKPSHLAPRGAGLLGRSMREVAKSLAAGRGEGIWGWAANRSSATDSEEME